MGNNIPLEIKKDIKISDATQYEGTKMHEVLHWLFHEIEHGSLGSRKKGQISVFYRSN